MLMECRGVDPKDYPSGAVPKGAEAVSPQHLLDQHLLPAHQLRRARARASGSRTPPAATTPTTSRGIDPAGPGDLQRQRPVRLLHHAVPGRTTARRYAGCSSQSMPPEATVSSVSIPNEVYAFTNTDGTGHLPVRGAHGPGEPVAGLLVDGAVHARGHPDRRHQLRQPRSRPRRATRPVTSPRARSTPDRRRRTRSRRRSGPPRPTGTAGCRCRSGSPSRPACAPSPRRASRCRSTARSCSTRRRCSGSRRTA